MQTVHVTNRTDEGRSIQEPHMPSPRRRDFINQLPTEILINVFRNSLDPARPGRDLSRLRGVCNLWKSIVESTPSLWNYISADDGIQYIRDAITKTGEVSLDLVYRWYGDTTMTVEDFLTAVMDKSKYWRSVDIAFWRTPSTYPGLQSMPCRTLEALELWHALESSNLPEAFSLFGGMSAPPTLKKLTLGRVPVRLESLELVELEALTLVSLGPQSMLEIIRILKTSPRLVTLVLEDIVGLQPPQTGAAPAIQLQHLETLKLQLPVSTTEFLLSTLYTEKVDRLTVDPECSSFLPSMLFTPSVTHWVPVLRRMVQKAGRIEIGFEDSDLCFLKLGKLDYLFQMEFVDRTQFGRDILDWHLANLGEAVAHLPARLSYHNVCPHFGDIRLFSQLPEVTELSISHIWRSEQVPSKLFKALGSPTRSKPPEWLLPNLLILHYDLNNGCHKSLLAMLKRRYGSRGNAEPSLDELAPPPSLREIRFYGGTGKTWAPTKDEALLREVQLLSKGAQIYWVDELHVLDD
ncbi:hypothetical protein FRC01_001584 [Tulasnella sp. 417]|nr:hypothetical protein FRC01_001584 [Tulasnella sp. 417]